MFASLFMMLASYDEVDRRSRKVGGVGGGTADEDLEHSRDQRETDKRKGVSQNRQGRNHRGNKKRKELVVCPPFPGVEGMMMMTSKWRRGEEKVADEVV